MKPESVNREQLAAKNPVAPAPEDSRLPNASDPSDMHRTEVAEGKRFEFGKNWARFLSWLTPERLELAESSLRNFLQSGRLDGKKFLDIGSGSGLFSLAARSLGARVRSFDYDPHSVACTRVLRREYFGDDEGWVVEQGSVLDQNFLRSLGTYDVVYSWGVLHHTGAMWQALENVKPLVAIGGQLFISVYNDQGEATDHWARIKQRYNALPRPLAFLFALAIIAKEESKQIRDQLRGGSLSEWLRTWTQYDKISTRGMSRWHDWIDWIGGYPYERASVDEIVDACAKDGFRLTKLMDRSNGYGCNEFVFRRDAAAGNYIDTPIPGGRSVTRRFGHRVTGPFERTNLGWTGMVHLPSSLPDGVVPFLVRERELLGPAVFASADRVVLAPEHAGQPDIEGVRYHIVIGRIRPMPPPYQHERGHMWQIGAPDLDDLADREGQGNDTRSCVFVLEDGRQLPYPHAAHNDIDRHGAGRFSHWHGSILFSAEDSSDPNTNGRRYELIIAQWE